MSLESTTCTIKQYTPCLAAGTRLGDMHVTWGQAPLCIHVCTGCMLQEQQADWCTQSRHWFNFYVVMRTVCKGSAQDALLKTEVSLPLLHVAQIQTSWISCMLWGQNFVSATKLSCKNGHVTQENVTVLCPLLIIISWTCSQVCASKLYYKNAKYNRR